MVTLAACMEEYRVRRTTQPEPPSEQAGSAATGAQNSLSVPQPVPGQPQGRDWGALTCAPPGPAALCPGLCLKPSVLTGDSRTPVSWEAARGGRAWGRQERSSTSQGSCPCPPGGKQVCSELVISVSSWRSGQTPALVKDETPGEEPGSIQGYV